MKQVPHRVVIYTKDVMNITGKGQRSAQRMIQRIKEHFGKHPTSFISLDEFCHYTGLRKEELTDFVR